MNYQFIKVNNENGIINIKLNRPPYNVLHIPALKELLSAFQWAKEAEGTLILLDAEGKSFSSGVDIGDHKPDKGDEISVFYQIFKTMFEIEKPIVCAVDGYALGGGCELAICSDIIIASDKAKFGQPEINVGATATIAVYMLPRILSWPQTMDLLLSGEHISAKKAEQVGLINAVLPSKNFAEEVNNYIQKYLKNSPLLLRKVKQSLMVSKNKAFEEAILAVRKIVKEEIVTSHDGIEGLNAFLEKRKPVWLGK